MFFVGTVRNNDRAQDGDAEKGVTALPCSAHPSAEAELRKTAAKFPDVIGIAADRPVSAVQAT